jgi:dTDP-glucose 4,6-dehydratase
MRVLLTGAAGAIGVHVLTHFMETTDWEVVCLDSFRHKGWRDRITKLCADYQDRIHIYQHDLVCPVAPELAAQMGEVDYIIHLAAMSDVFFSVENPVYVVKNNVDSTLTILEYARQVKPKAFVYFSTDEVYGPVPKGEAHVEGEPHRPSNAYAASKAACEDICRAWWRSYGVPLIITNTMNNFGETQAPSKFPAMVQKLVEGGKTVTIHGNDKEIGTRFYIHSRQTAEALVRVLEKGVVLHTQGELDEPNQYHIVGERAFSNLELAKLIAQLMNKPLDYKLEDFHKDNPAHDIHYGLKNSRLDWEPSRTVKQALKATIDWQQANKEWL